MPGVTGIAEAHRQPGVLGENEAAGSGVRQSPVEGPTPGAHVALGRFVSVSVGQPDTPAADDEHERRARLLLLGKAAVSAHRFDRPLAAEMDETEDRTTRPSWTAAFRAKRKLARAGAAGEAALGEGGHRPDPRVDGRAAA